MSDERAGLSHWREYAALYRGAGAHVAASVALAVGQSLLVLPIAYLVKRAFDQVIPARDTGALAWLVAGLAGLYLVNIAATLATRHLALDTTKRAIARMRLQLLDTISLLPRRFFDRSDHAHLHNTIVQDTERVDVMSNAVLVQVVPALTIGVAVCGWLALLNARLFAMTVLLLPLALLTNRWLGARVRRHVAAYRDEFEGLSGLVWRTLRMLDLTRAQAAEHDERVVQVRIVDALRMTSGRMAWLSSAYSLIQAGLTALTGLLILLVGGIAVSRGTMTIGGLLSFYVGTTFLTAQASVVLSAVPTIISGDESLKSVMALLGQPERSPYSGRRRLALTGQLAFDHVSMEHGGPPVLSDVSLSVPAHTSLAIIGPNGSGKSTLAHLVLGFYRPTSGRLLVDGIPYDDIDLRDLRRAMGVVTQNPPLLSGTVLDNITYGVADANQEDVERAARCATADAFIAQLPDGYLTRIGEDGVRLSGGQRQQIALARAVLGRPSLLLLDEPTNHLDTAAVAALLENIAALPQRPTIVMTTHDERVARWCDRVVVLEAPAGRTPANISPYTAPTPTYP